jgi:uncharacterized membrane protein YbhN (UPF0104 family)
MDKKKSGGRPWLRVLGILVIFIVFLALFDIELIIEQIRNADWGYLGTAFVVLFLSYLVMTVRLRYLLGNKLKLSFMFHAMNVSSMMNLVMFVPTTAIRIFLIGQNKKVTIPQTTSGITLSVVLDWIIKIIAILGAILLTLQSVSVSQLLIVSGVLIVIIVGSLLLIVAKADTITRKVSPLLARLPMLNEEQSKKIMVDLMEGLQVAGSPWRLLVAFAWTLLGWLGGFAFYYFALLSMKIELPPDQMLAAIFAASAFVNPFSPYIPGVYHGMLVGSIYLVTRYDPEPLLALSIVMHGVLLVFWFGMGIWGLRGLDLKFSEFRKQIKAGVQQMRSKKDIEATS